jgi:hypothetical protein
MATIQKVKYSYVNNVHNRGAKINRYIVIIHKFEQHVEHVVSNFQILP